MLQKAGQETAHRTVVFGFGLFCGLLRGRSFDGGFRGRCFCCGGHGSVFFCGCCILDALPAYPYTGGDGTDAQKTGLCTFDDFDRNIIALHADLFQRGGNGLVVGFPGFFKIFDHAFTPFLRLKRLPDFSLPVPLQR